jgi:hypothetical protein
VRKWAVIEHFGYWSQPTRVLSWHWTKTGAKLAAHDWLGIKEAHCFLYSVKKLLP